MADVRSGDMPSITSWRKTHMFQTYTPVSPVGGPVRWVDRCIGSGQAWTAARRRYAARTHAPRRHIENIAGAGRGTLAQYQKRAGSCGPLLTERPNRINSRG